MCERRGMPNTGCGGGGDGGCIGGFVASWYSSSIAAVAHAEAVGVCIATGGAAETAAVVAAAPACMLA
jgi:hypothetical protein